MKLCSRNIRGLDPQYAFENLVVHPGNVFAHAACLEAAKHPGKKYNPLFIYGDEGLGKTHLLNAIGNYLLKHDTLDSAHICCVAAQDLSNEISDAVQRRALDDLTNRYRDFDALLVDDVQFFSAEERIKFQVNRIFHIVYDAMKQIVLTGDRIPRELANLPESLKTRFEWGLIVDVRPPGPKDLIPTIAFRRP